MHAHDLLQAPTTPLARILRLVGTVPLVTPDHATLGYVGGSIVFLFVKMTERIPTHPNNIEGTT